MASNYPLAGKIVDPDTDVLNPAALLEHIDSLNSTVNELKRELAYLKSQLARSVIVVVGGDSVNSRSDDPPPLDSAAYYDPQQDSWHPLPSMTTPRSRLAVVTLNNKIFAIGGDNTSGSLGINSMEAFDPLVGAWTLRAAMTQSRAGHAATVHKGFIYVAGGWHISLERYDPNENKWTTLDPMNRDRYYFTLTSVGSHLYAIGGDDADCDNASTCTSLERFDPTANQWTLFENVPLLARAGHAAVAFENEHGQNGVYLIGGRDEDATKLKTVQKVILTGNERQSSDFVLQSLPSLNLGRYDASATIADGTIYVTGGHDDYNHLNTMESFFLKSNSSKWTLHTPRIRQNRSCHGSSTLRLNSAALLQRNDFLNLTVNELRGEMAELRDQLSREGARKIQEEELAAWRIRSEEYAQDFDAFAQSDGLLQLTQDRFFELLGRDDLQATSEDVVIDALLRWVNEGGDASGSRKDQLFGLIQLVRLQYLDVQRLASLLVTFAESHTDPRVTELVRQVIVNRVAPNTFRLNEMPPRIPKSRDVGHVVETTESTDTDVLNPVALLEQIDSLNSTVNELRSEMAHLRSQLSTRDVIVVVGGESFTHQYDDPPPLDSAEYYDFQRDSWHPLPSMNTARSSLAVVTLNNKIFAIGGYNSSDYPIRSMEVYDPLVGTWTKKAAMTQARACHAASVHDGFIYVAGGIGHKPFERYDPTENKWSTLAPMRRVRYSFTLTSVGSHLYAIGGDDDEDGNANTSLERYDPTANQWTLFENVALLARADHAAVAFENEHGQNGVYLIGGSRRDDTRLNTVQKMILTGNERQSSDFVLQSLPSLNLAREDVSATISHGTIYATGGSYRRRNGTWRSHDTVESLSLNSNSPAWTLHSAKMTPKRCFHGSTTLSLPFFGAP